MWHNKAISSNQMTGVDISPVQIERARKLVPHAVLICADISNLDFSTESFDSIVAFYSIIHVPLADQPELFNNLKRWLVPGGYLLATVGYTQWTGTARSGSSYGEYEFTDDLGFTIGSLQGSLLYETPRPRLLF